MNPDEIHVLLDALTELRIGIHERGLKPWVDYEGLEGDPKVTAAGYESLMRDAERNLLRRLEEIT